MLKKLFLSELKIYVYPEIFVLFLLGFSSSIPVLLTGSTLGIWLKQEGIQYRDIGLMALAGLPYSFKFLWAPLVDRVKIPWLSKRLGRRRSWLLCSQIFLISLLFCISMAGDLVHNLGVLIFLCFCVNVASATQKMLMLTYQIERLRMSQYGAGEAMGIFGYRMGFLWAGAGALYLSHYLSWPTIYQIMAATVGLGLMTTLVCQEPEPLDHHVWSPEKEQDINRYGHGTTSQSKRGGLLLLRWIRNVFARPFEDYRRRPAWAVILFIMLFYKGGDDMINGMKNLFYLDLGYSKIEIANASKLFGMWATILGGFLGGIWTMRQDMLKSLFYLGLLHVLGMTGYLILSYVGHDRTTLYMTIAFENITGGMRMTAFLAYQLTLCRSAYASTQLALLTSFVNLGHVLCAAPSGWLVECLGWDVFFGLGMVLNLSVLGVIFWLVYFFQHPLKDTLRPFLFRLNQKNS